jgi:nucleoside-diphosphate-sugar epimerase
MGKKVVVTGGAGFIGSNLVRELLAKKYEVHSVDNYSAGKMKERLFEGVTYHELDIRSTKDIEKVFSGADVVFHTAAKPRVQVSIDEPLDTTENNVSGTVSVLKAATDASVRRIVYSSSSSVYGDQETLPLKETMPAMPVHPYGLQKYAAEMFTSLWPSIYKLETVSLRYFNIYGPLLDPEGPYALAVGRFITAKKSGQPITIYGDGTVTRDFTHVTDAVSANILAAESHKVGKGEIINVGAGRNVSIQALADMFGGEIVYGPPRIEAHDSLADISRAKELLGWEPTVRLEDGVAELKKLFGV